MAVALDSPRKTSSRTWYWCLHGYREAAKLAEKLHHLHLVEYDYDYWQVRGGYDARRITGLVRCRDCGASGAYDTDQFPPGCGPLFTHHCSCVCPIHAIHYEIKRVNGVRFGWHICPDKSWCTILIKEIPCV